MEKSYDLLYKGFNTNAFFGRDSDQLTDKQKEDLVRSRLTAVFEAGLPPLKKIQDNPQFQSNEGIENNSED